MAFGVGGGGDMTHPPSCCEIRADDDSMAAGDPIFALGHTFSTFSGDASANDCRKSRKSSTPADPVGVHAHHLP